jgi:hypothetical protein
VSQNNENTPQFSPEQVIAINSLCAGLDKHAAAKAAKVTYRTINRWLLDPSFAAEITMDVVDRMSPVSEKIIEGAIESIDVIIGTVRDTGADRNIRLKAAQYLVDSAYRLMLVEPLKKRLEEVEAALAATRN